MINNKPKIYNFILFFIICILSVFFVSVIAYAENFYEDYLDESEIYYETSDDYDDNSVYEDISQDYDNQETEPLYSEYYNEYASEDINESTNEDNDNNEFNNEYDNEYDNEYYDEKSWEYEISQNLFEDVSEDISENLSESVSESIYNPFWDYYYSESYYNESVSEPEKKLSSQIFYSYAYSNLSNSSYNNYNDDEYYEYDNEEDYQYTDENHELPVPPSEQSHFTVDEPIDTSVLTSEDWKKIQNGNVTDQNSGIKLVSDSSSDNEIADIKDNETGNDNDTWKYLMLGIFLIITGFVIIIVIVVTTIKANKKEYDISKIEDFDLEDENNKK